MTPTAMPPSPARWVSTAGEPFPPADDRLYGPDGFAAGWLLLGIAAVVVAVAVVVWVLWRSRPSPIVAETQRVVGLRTRYLLHLDDLERQLVDRRLAPRALHHELSRTLRRFAADGGTAGATAMSATALRAAGLSHVAAAVAGYEHPQFEAHPDGDPLAALAVARAVVAGTGAAGSRSRS